MVRNNPTTKLAEAIHVALVGTVQSRAEMAEDMREIRQGKRDLIVDDKYSRLR